MSLGIQEWKVLEKQNITCHNFNADMYDILSLQVRARKLRLNASIKSWQIFAPNSKAIRLWMATARRSMSASCSSFSSLAMTLTLDTWRLSTC